MNPGNFGSDAKAWGMERISVMQSSNAWRTPLLSLAVALFVAASSSVAMADEIAYFTQYGGTASDAFGTIDLNTGAVTELGYTSPTGTNAGVVTVAGLGELTNSGVTTLYTVSQAGELYTVNKATGAVTPVGSLALSDGDTVADFGSTTSGLYAIDNNHDLLTVNPVTGMATSVAAVSGVNYLGAGFDSLSVASSTLFYANGGESSNSMDVLYTIDTSTGVATAVGNMATNGTANMGGIAELPDGNLYGLNLTYECIGCGYGVDTINTSTADLAPVAGVGDYEIDGLAPVVSSSPTSVPEPSALTMLLSSLLGFGLSVAVKRHRGNRLATIA